ncbi:HAD-IIIC family phosphatase [Dactylosporangium darangshiense]|uniref:HAD-IIIC family phosphatase n=1 Tax=Dactylosporangium darangshiense TaxID=579108 RepID=A0ABP8DEX0_9ACTN
MDLLAEYPDLPARLAEAGPDELLRTGRLLQRIDPADLRAKHPSLPAVSAAIVGHGTLATLRTALTAEAARHGLVLEATVGDFDGYVFDLGDPGSTVYQRQPQIVLCALDAEEVFANLEPGWTAEDAGAAAEALAGRVAGLAEHYVAHGTGVLVLNTVPLPAIHAHQLVDYRSRARLGIAWRAANTRLLELAATDPRIVVLDLDPIAAEGIAVHDPRMSTYAKAHLSDALLLRYARQAGHLCRALAGRTRKVLALDLDNTVWGGVLGDDGIDGIEVHETYRGEAFRAFQRVARQLGTQGVLLAAVSKNDLEPVQQALREHPGMTLREDDFAHVTANWQPKSDNLARLAETLNLGLDAFVFADDSPYECGLVRAELPQVAVVQLDDEPARHVTKLLRDGWFDALDVTAEDRARTALYRQEAQRSSFLQRFDSIEEYLAGLEVTVAFDAARAEHVPRLSQITLRTNQFNLTTQRLQQSDVRARLDDPAHLVLTIHAGDRFGDNGLVGAVFARRSADRLDIDNMLLSCRVFARGIEQTCLAALLRHARATGVREVHAGYVATAKNGNVRDLFPSYGFAVATDDGASRTFRHDLTDVIEPAPHVRLVTQLEGASR